MEAVRRGFKLVVQNIEPLKMFTPNEMEQLFCGRYLFSNSYNFAFLTTSFDSVAHKPILYLHIVPNRRMRLIKLGQKLHFNRQFDLIMGL